MTGYKYQEGFGNHFSSEALPDALPKGKSRFHPVLSLC
jgi:homogentisate 1,2-dioxygenase